MRILITGGAGYLGTELVKKLQNRKDIKKIIILDNLTRKNYNFLFFTSITKGNVNFVYGDILDSRLLKKLMNEVDIVYHFAGITQTPTSYEMFHIYEEVNNWGTAEVVYAIEKSNVRKIIYLNPILANDIILNSYYDPSILSLKSIYELTKLKGEKHIKILSNKIETIILRCAEIYGYGNSIHFDNIINRFILYSLTTKNITVYGNGEQLKPFIYIDYIIDLLINLLYNKNDSATYNVADKVLSINKIIETIKKFNPDLEVKYLNEDVMIPSTIVKPDDFIIKYSKLKRLTFDEEIKNFLKKIKNKKILS